MMISNGFINNVYICKEGKKKKNRNRDSLTIIHPTTNRPAVNGLGGDFGRTREVISPGDIFIRKITRPSAESQNIAEI